MVTTQDKLVFIPITTSERVVTIGPDHINYKGGIGGVMNVYSKYFGAYKYVTTHKEVNEKWQQIPFFLLQTYYFVKLIIEDKDIRIVHIQGSSHGSFYRKFILFIIAKYGFKLKIIYHMHGSRFERFYVQSDFISRKLVKFLAENSDIVICLSDYWKNFFNSSFRTKRLEILGNVIDKVDNVLIKRVKNDKLNLLFLGAVGERKGIFDLLEAISASRHFFSGRLILTVGGNGETIRLENYIREHHLEDLVQYVGWVSGEKKHQLLSNSDLYILPSYNEGLPISILEAMSYHLPIISTPVGGTAEVVREDVNGFLIDPGDKAAMITRIKRFIDEPKLLTEMGHASGQLVKNYLPETIFPKLNELYESLLDK